MKTGLILAALVALAAAATIGPQNYHDLKTTPVDAQFVKRQTKILSLLEQIKQVNPEAEYYKVGKDYDIEADIQNYTNKTAVEDFLYLYRKGFIPKYQTFSIFYDKLEEEAIALYHLFYYAKDFETFYKVASWARIYLNEGQYLYSFYAAVIHRPDFQGLLLPPPYEVFPFYYINSDVFTAMYYVKMQGGFTSFDLGSDYGIVKENDYYIFYSNYSNTKSYSYHEDRLAYFTEDIGWNAYYFYNHLEWPFWKESPQNDPFKLRRGENFYFFYQRFLARYYLERLVSGLGEIPDFSWYQPIKEGYRPMLYKTYPFVQRNDYYKIPVHYEEDLQFLESYETNFLLFLDKNHLKPYNQEVDLHNSKSINFVGNYWQGTADLYENSPRHYERSYISTARKVLSGVPEFNDKYSILPSALTSYQTSARDPLFYQLYSKIIKYAIQYKQNLRPYTREALHYVGVKVTDVEVDRLVTYFDLFDIDATNGVFLNQNELKSKTGGFKVRQQRLNHKPFQMTIDIKSDVISTATLKVFLAPKFDSFMEPLSLEQNWMNFIEVDWFQYNLTQGQNKIVRKSEDFFWYQEDDVTISKIYQLLEQSKVPSEMVKYFKNMPNRLLLPKGYIGGYPLQLLVVVYPNEPASVEYQPYQEYIVDNKPLGFPLDRPVDATHFTQPNIYFKDVLVYHEGELFPNYYNYPGYAAHQNLVPKH